MRGRPSSYPVPPNENQRLAHLEQLGILHSAQEPPFDALVAVACRMFGVPIALVSLIGKEEQSFKAACGLSFSKTKRELAFCNYPVATNEVLVVENAAEDVRFRKNPYVTGEPNIRFYAGAPICIEPGLVLGAFCIIDTKPRALSEVDKASLTEMAGVVSSLIKQYRFSNSVAELTLKLQQQSLELRDHARHLTRYKRMFDRGMTLIKTGAWEWDVETGEVTWTDGMFDMHDMPHGSPLDPKLGKASYTAASRAELNRLFEISDRDCTGFTFEGEMITAKKARKWVRLTVDVESERGKVVRRFGVKQDITEQKAMMDRLRFLAECDPLTNLANRTMLQQHLQGAGPVGSGPQTLLLVDLDGFKHVNDTYGHEAGDVCLKQVADRLRRTASSAELICRLGGDEFAMLLAGDDPNTATEYAHRVLESMRVPVLLNGNSFQLSASIGISVAKATDDQQLLLTQADLALYAAKSAGRNTLRVFLPEMRDAAEMRTATVQSISLALTRGELELFYQPKISISGDRLAGFEALLRWRRPDGRVIAAGAFSTALEDPELSRNIGVWVVETALRQARAWHRLGLDFGHIAINMSAIQFRDPGFAERLIEQIKAHDLEPEMIEAEITEGVFLGEENGEVCRALHQLRAAGVRIALDDFGTGFASLTHLRSYPVDVLKIDRSFVQNSLTSDRDQAILQSMLFLASRLNLDVVAEGVEDAAQYALLRAFGCKYVQGYLFSKALPASEAVNWCGRLLALSA